jgi:hypothetical protein
MPISKTLITEDQYLEPEIDEIIKVNLKGEAFAMACATKEHDK